MPDPTLTCPKCGALVPLTESLAGPIVAKMRADLEVQHRAALAAQRTAIADEESQRARAAVALDLEKQRRDLADAQARNAQLDQRLAEAQKAQTEALRLQRQLDDQKRELDLTIEARVQSGLADERTKAQQIADDTYKLKLAEKDQTIAGLQQQAEALKRRADQGSQQLQGEVLELELEAQLAAAFPADIIAPVPKGAHGGDILHTVNSPQGKPCAIILWEAKRTKNWSDAWLPKLREDQRRANAQIAILSTQALPQGADSFALVEGVWVTAPRFALPLANLLRGTFLAVAATHQQHEGLQSKLDVVFQYLTSANFRHRISAVLEHNQGMRDDLDRERKSMTKLWAKREAQIAAVALAAAGLYGDLQGILGSSLAEIEQLSLPADPAALPATTAE